MRLVKNWKEAWKWFSMWAFGLIAAVPAAWLSLPEDVKKMVPESWEQWIFVAISIAAVLGGGGRLMDQSKKEPG